MTKLRQLTIGLGFLCMHKWLNFGVRHPFCYVHVDNVVVVSNFKNLIKVIMNAYLKNGGLTKELNFLKKCCVLMQMGLMCLRGKTKVTKYIRNLKHLFPWVFIVLYIRVTL